MEIYETHIAIHWKFSYLLFSFRLVIVYSWYTCSQERERDHFNGFEKQVKHDELINICFKIEINEHLTLADFWNANTTSVCLCTKLNAFKIEWMQFFILVHPPSYSLYNFTISFLIFFFSLWNTKKEKNSPTQHSNNKSISINNGNPLKNVSLFLWISEMKNTTGNELPNVFNFLT